MNDSPNPRVGEILERELPGLQRDVPVGPHCAYRVGGPAEYLYTASRTEALRHAVVMGRELDLPVTVNGSIERSSIRGKLNGGGPLLEITTGDGSIRVSKF